MLFGRFRLRTVSVAFVLFLASCTGEEPVEIDLNATIPPAVSSTVVVPPGADDPNAGERARMEDLARQQCLEDPTKEVGTVRIVDPTTNDVISEVVVVCAEVR